MANTVRIKRRASGGAAGAPSSLQNAELAFNEQDNTLYYGWGNGGTGGTATNVIAIGGPGSFATLNSTQTFTGVKTFDQAPLVPTLPFGTNTLAAASTAFVQAAVSAASIPDGDKGDITVTNDGATWTIDNGTVTNAKMASMSANTFKGRGTGSGAPQDLTVAQVKTALAINNVDNTSDADKPISTATATALASKVDTSLIGAANGLATLDSDQKIPVSQLPSIAISDTFVVGSEAAMLALDAQTGDIAIRTDLNQTFILADMPASSLGNWEQLVTPTSPVTSVFGRTGAISAAAGDYTVAQVTGAAPIASPTFTGTPSGPTPAAGDNSTRLATTAWVTSKGYTNNSGTVTSVAGSGGTTGLTFTGSPVTSSGTLTLGGTLAVSAGGTGSTTAAGARTGLGLGTMAIQNANAVSITGGTIDNIVIDGGTF